MEINAVLLITVVSYIIWFDKYSIFLSIFLRHCFLCWDRWNGDVKSILDTALLCSSRAGSDVGSEFGLGWRALYHFHELFITHGVTIKFGLRLEMDLKKCNQKMRYVNQGSPGRKLPLCHLSHHISHCKLCFNNIFSRPR